MVKKSTRDQIIEAADQLFYEQGFEQTSFADIAEAVQLSRGNFYYHFKSKDELLDAVIDLRLAQTQLMLDRWQIEGGSPQERIRSFIRILLVNQGKIKRFGCPVGSLSTELTKLGHQAEVRVQQLFTLFRAWLAEHFRALDTVLSPDDLAMHLLARSQGVATLAQAFKDDRFILLEVQAMYEWLDRLALKPQN